MAIIIRRKGQVSHVAETGVDHEGDLQQFIFDNPESLPLDDIKEEPRLMIIGREFATGSGPVDVLAIDVDGDVYVIETKLYKNPDKRRVVAQLLDYGAALWRSGRDQAGFAASLDASVNKMNNWGLRQSIAEFYDLAEEDADEVVRRVCENVSNGSLRFIVLMDHLEPRLRDLVLFLNERSQFTVYAVVMQFYRDQDVEVVIPKLFGAEARSGIPTGGPRSSSWNKSRFFEDVKEQLSSQEIAAVRRLYKFCVQHADQVRWARGTIGAFRPQFKRPYAELSLQKKVQPLFKVDTGGVLTMMFPRLVSHAGLRMYADHFLAKLDELGFPLPSPEQAEDSGIQIADWRHHVDALIEAVREVFLPSAEE